MNKYYKYGIELGVAWLAPFLFLIILSSWYLPVEVNSNLALAFAVFSLIVALFIILYKHHIAHAGHLFLVIGLLLFLYSAGMIVGAFAVFDKSSWWTLSDPEIGLYTFTGIVGLIAFLDGIKQMWQSRYFVGRGRGR